MTEQQLQVGASVELLATGQRGIIRFLGQTSFSAGDWVGIELNDGSGKNDGSVQGERYFDCEMGYGVFVRPHAVTVLAPPAPKPAVGGSKRVVGGRPSSVVLGSGRNVADAALNKRKSLNAPSPSPVPRTSRPSSIARSPTKSPTKMMAPGTATSSASNSRTGTPSNMRPSVGAKPRPSVGASRTSMGPPPLPGARTTRQVSAAAPGARTSTAAPVRSVSARQSVAAAGRVGGPPSRTGSARNLSGGSGSGNEASKSGVRSGIASPRKSSDDGILSPQPTSPVQAKTRALERLTRGASPVIIQKPTTMTAGSAPRVAAGSANTTALTAEVESLKKKIQFLEGKRKEDREKVRAWDELQTDNKMQKEKDVLLGKLRVLSAQLKDAQGENSELKSHLLEAEQRLESIESMQQEHDTALELATLDREMAEETAEVYKAELDALKQKSEELELEVEILREENAEFTKGMTPDERASTGWLQMERNNERLRDALIRLRDLTQQREEELQEQIKGLEDDLQEFDVLKEQHAVAQETLAKNADVVAYLQEQLDTSANAEVMISELQERNMEQSERIDELKATIEELETSLEVSEELEINHSLNAKEMKEELDFKDSVIAEQARRAAQQEQLQEEMEDTLFKFRELVNNLQGDLEDMRASQAVTEVESEQLNSRSRAMQDLNMKLQISAAKAQVKAVDLELRRLEAEEAEQHLEIVKLFLPESYQSDRDSVMALLRFKRLAFKANLLNSTIKERFNGQPHPGHEDDLFWGCEANDRLTWVSSMCDRFVNAMSHCSLAEFAKYQGALYELEPVERALNAWIDGLRRDDLKEKQCATELQRTIALMTHLGEVHIPKDLESYADDVHMKVVLSQTYLDSAASTFATIKGMVQRLVPPSSEDDELAIYFAKRADGVITQTRSTKVTVSKVVRELEELKARSLSLLPETLEAFESCEAGTRELAELARKIGMDLHHLLHEEGRTEPFTYAEVQSCVQSAVLSFQASEADLFAAYLTKLRVVSTQISDLAALSKELDQTQEFESSPPPWVLRSQELKTLRSVPADAEEELRRLKDDHAAARHAVALRDESLSEAHLKIETLESRMRDAKAKAARIIELEARIDELDVEGASLRDDVEKQDRELKTLEADRDRWKKIASDSRVVPANGAAGGTDAEGGKAGQERAVATAREMDALHKEIENLQAAVRFLREDSRRARTTEQACYDWLAEPLRKPAPIAEQRRKLVAAEARDALGELVRLAGEARLYDFRKEQKEAMAATAGGGAGAGDGDKTKSSFNKLAWRPAKTTPRYQAAQHTEALAAWQDWRDAVVQKGLMLKQTEEAAALHQRAGDVEPAKEKIMRNPAATLQIRLPGLDGKVMPGMRGRPVQIVGSREWEGLQGRLVAI